MTKKWENPGACLPQLVSPMPAAQRIETVLYFAPLPFPAVHLACRGAVLSAIVQAFYLLLQFTAELQAGVRLLPL